LITQAELIIIKRYLKPKKKEGILKIISIFSFLGIGLGVATLIIVMSVMNGFRTDLIGKLLLFQPHIVVYQFDNYEKDKDKIKDVLKKNNIKYESIKLAYATQGLVVSKTLNQGTNIRAIKKNDFLLDKLINKNITRGSVENFGNGYVSIGLNFSESLGVSIGDKITVLSSAKESTPFGNVPQQFSFTVGSVFESGIYEFDSNYILIDIGTSQDFLQNHENNKNIELKLNDADDAATVKQILEKSKFQSFSWIDNNKSFYDALLVERNVMFIILTLIVIVAAFNIISGLTILVKNKTKEIAILKTIGFSSLSINKIFFITGASIGAAGTLFGVILGVLFSYNIEKIRVFLSDILNIEIFPAEIYFLSKMPSEIHIPTILLISCIALAITFFSSIVPSIKASKINPIQSLKYD
jgi:lipoprotein-releasing system permease protein|tara:strand:+ start:47 stop:1282 length:1236 start_codon:yes stop_codon:yes gene_type:complete